jgi:polyvinyl alcohol dehydrogenase (cytochrome)
LISKLKRLRQLLALVAVGSTLAVPVLLGASPASADSPDSAATLGQSGDWASWQKDLSGTRYNGDERAINPTSLSRLRLKWAFVLPNPDGQNSGQPSVAGDTVFVGGRDSKMYALNAATGATRWSFDVTPIAGASGTSGNPLRDAPAVAGNMVIFGDTRGFLYAVDRQTGKLIWDTRLSTHQAAQITSSPIVYHGRVYVGVSSGEEVLSSSATYPCCTFRGSLVSLDLATGAVVWQYYTVPPPVQTGTGAGGTPTYAPSGVAVWSSPVVDPRTDTVFVATGNNYTGTAGDADSVLALNATNGAVRWKQKMTDADQWTVGCVVATPVNCPGLADGTNLDYDFGATPNLFSVRGRLLVGVGQKSGIYHTFDAKTGAIVWQQQVSIAKPDGAESGIQWGTSYDGVHIYAASWQAEPGTLFALNPATGKIQWSTPNPPDGCSTGGAASFPTECNLSLVSAVSSTPGLVYEGSIDGKMRIYSSSDGKLLWQYDTVRSFTGVNGLTASGGSIAGVGGAVISHGTLYVQSGFTRAWGIPGHVLLAFSM